MSSKLPLHDAIDHVVLELVERLAPHVRLQGLELVGFGEWVLGKSVGVTLHFYGGEAL